MHPLPQSDFTSLLDRLDLPDDIIGYFLGVSKTSIRNWRKGTHEVPEGVIFELAELVRVIDEWFVWMDGRKG